MMGSMAVSHFPADRGESTHLHGLWHAIIWLSHHDRWRCFKFVFNACIVIRSLVGEWRVGESIALQKLAQ